MLKIPRTIFNEEHEMFRSSLRDFIAKEITPYNLEWEKNKMVSRESWLKLGENGFLGIQAPDKFGGMGINDFRYNAVFIEELGLSGCAGPAIGYPLHNDIVLPYVLHYATEEAKQKYVPKMISGDYISAVAMTEPGAGSDLQNIRATAEDKGDHYLLNGTKTFITNGYLADVVVVAAKTDPKLGAKGISLFIVDRDMKGFTKGVPFDKVGLHAQDTCELFFEDVKVPKENLMGKTGWRRRGLWWLWRPCHLLRPPFSPPLTTSKADRPSEKPLRISRTPGSSLRKWPQNWSRQESIVISWWYCTMTKKWMRQCLREPK
jgi:alkylation response protein AidB-like acyl-CoA dehydrogenase